jgi:hypothetical protein
MKPYGVLLLAAVLATGVFAAGCGKKGPPVPPSQPPVPAAAHLTGDINNAVVTLRWQLDPSAGNVTVYTVYRAAYSLSGPQCPTCPMVFQKIGTVTVEKGEEALSFSERVPLGFHYTYKVRPHNTGALSEPDSNTVGVDAAQE